MEPEPTSPFLSCAIPSTFLKRTRVMSEPGVQHKQTVKLSIRFKNVVIFFFRRLLRCWCEFILFNICLCMCVRACVSESVCVCVSVWVFVCIGGFEWMCLCAVRPCSKTLRWVLPWVSYNKDRHIEDVHTKKAQKTITNTYLLGCKGSDANLLIKCIVKGGEGAPTPYWWKHKVVMYMIK